MNRMQIYNNKKKGKQRWFLNNEVEENISEHPRNQVLPPFAHSKCPQIIISKAVMNENNKNNSNIANTIKLRYRDIR